MNHEESIFEQALGIVSPQAREEFLRGACVGNPAMFERVQGLLRAHDRAGKFLEHVRPADGAFGVPPSGGAPPGPAEAGTPNLPLTEKPGDHIGRYKLLQKIGEGGCGVVYMAEQEEPVRRRVALKIIKLGMDTRQVIARFEAERQALALMDHPNIAKVFDAGATDAPAPGIGETASGRIGDSPARRLADSPSQLPAGRPYFVMELVRGVKITEYSDEKKLTTWQRLELFTQVCRAVQHAHQKGIIHRDLKPSNILVSFNDGVAVPKVIDFGIAKATTGEPLTDKTVFTAFEQFIGTPAYMSPEQALVTSLDIDTRTDIYSLGVLLYELLTGKTPFDPKELQKGGLEAMRRTICEREPLRPSTRLSTLPADALSTTAQRRGLDALKLASQLRGDLDWIVMKCLEKDRARRYETANGLATDIQRHLNNEPIVARPPSNLYRIQKTVRRNKLGFGAGAAVVAALIIGFGFSTVMFLRERQARQREHQLRQEAELRELNLIAFQLLADGKLAEAEAARRRVLDIQRKLGSREHPDVAESLESLSRILLKEGKLSEAENTFREALEVRRKLSGEENPIVAQSISDGADFMESQGKLIEAEAMHRAVEGLHVRGHFRARRGNFREAAADYARAIELDPARTHDWHCLAVLLVESSQIDAYREHCRKSMERFRNTTEPTTAEQIAKDCLILPDSGIELSVAVQLINFAVSATNHEHIAWFELAKGLAEYRQDHFTSAIEWMQKLLDRGGGNLALNASAEIVMAMAHQRLKHTDEARLALGNALKITDAELPKSHAGDLGPNWSDWLVVRALMREAKALIEGGPGG